MVLTGGALDTVAGLQWRRPPSPQLETPAGQHMRTGALTRGFVFTSFCLIAIHTLSFRPLQVLPRGRRQGGSGPEVLQARTGTRPLGRSSR